MMIRTIQCPLPLEQSLIDTVCVYNQAVQVVIDAGWELRSYNKNVLHAKTYAAVREQLPNLQSSLVQCARDMASASLKLAKKKGWQCKKPVKKPTSSIRFNQRTFTPFLESGTISISTIDGRKVYPIVIPSYFQRYQFSTVNAMVLKVKNDKIIAFLNIEIADPIVNDRPTSFLGVDRGINNAVVASDNTFLNSSHIKDVKYKYQKLRQSLQSKGTRRCKRKLKSLAGRERRFMTGENYKIAAWLVAKPFDCIVLENLKGIKTNSKKQKKVGKQARKRFANWAYYQLELIITNKALEAGKMVLFVSPKYTSQRCSRCGHVAKDNRHGAEFCCKQCGFSIHADLNAARNISERGKAVFGRAKVNRPNVARYDAAEFLPRIAAASPRL
nr:transposase [Candidatus Sigynarchaeota archaeon]